MLAIHVNNHFSDNFVFLCHIDYFINDNERKLTAGYICRTFYNKCIKDTYYKIKINSTNLLFNILFVIIFF